jgi:RNA polymerase sigma factor (sigma-70 family)
MSDLPGDSKKRPGGVAESDGVALLPPQVTTATLSVDTSPALWAGGAARTSAELSDDELVLAIQSGDRKVGKQLYSRLVRVIDATLSRVLGPAQPDHDDLVQAVFEEVVRTIYKGQFKGRCRLTSWAASIACHVGLNAIRSRKTERGVFERTADADEAAPPPSGSQTERALEARDELRRLRATLATLSEGRAEAVLLHDALGYDLAEVAALTGSSEAAVQSRLVRGRRDLLERMQKEGQ